MQVQCHSLIPECKNSHLLDKFWSKKISKSTAFCRIFSKAYFLRSIPHQKTRILMKKLLLAIDEQIRKTFLRRIQYFCKIILLAIFVKNLVSLGKLSPIVFGTSLDPKCVTKFLYQLQELFTSFLSFRSVKIILLETLMNHLR